MARVDTCLSSGTQEERAELRERKRAPLPVSGALFLYSVELPQAVLALRKRCCHLGLFVIPRATPDVTARLPDTTRRNHVYRAGQMMYRSSAFYILP